MGAFDDLIPGYFQPDLAEGRTRFSKELDDPGIQSAFNQRIANEVGGQTPEEQQAFIESVLNRANARKQNLSDVVNDRSYFPSQSFRDAGDVDFSPLISKALLGSNVSKRATGNESADVHSGGAPVTMKGRAGERFVVENADMAFPFADLIPGNQNRGGGNPFEDLIPKVVPTAPPQDVQQKISELAKGQVTPTPQELNTLEAPEGSPQREDINRSVAGNVFAPPGAFAREPSLSELINASMPQGVQEAQRDEKRIPLAPPLPEQGRFEQGGVLGVLDPALEAGESVARGLAPRTDSWGHLITDLGALATPPVQSVQELMDAPENARKDYANARAQMEGRSLSELPFPERLDPVTAAQQMPEGPEKQQALLNAGANVVAQMLMAKGIAHGIARPAPSHLRTEPLVPDPPPSPPMGPTTIAGDVSRALERRFNLVPEPPPDIAPAPTIEDILHKTTPAPLRMGPRQVFDVDPDITQSLARRIQAQQTLTPDVVRALAERGQPTPIEPEVPRAPVGPISETAVEKAMRTTAPPLQTAGEIAAGEPPSFTLPDIPGVTEPPSARPEQPAPVSQQRVVPSETAVTPGARERMILNKRTEILKRKKELTARASNGEQGLEAQLAAVQADLLDPSNPVVHAPPKPQEGPVQASGVPPGAGGDIWYHSGELSATGEPNMPLYLSRDKTWTEGYAKPGSVTRQFRVKGKIKELQPGERDELVWNSPYSEAFRQQLIKEGYVGVSDPLAAPNAQLAVIDPRALESVEPPPPDYTPEAAAARAAQPQPEAPPVQTDLPESGFSTERAQKIYGEDAVLITKGKSPEAWKAIGQADKRNPYDVLEKARARKIATPDEAANLRAEHQRLLQRARQQYGTPEYNDLAQNAVDFFNATKEVVHGPASDIFRGLQEVDKPTYMSPADYDNILRERQMQATPDETATFKKVTDEVRNGDRQAREAAANGQEALKKYRPRDVVPFDEATDYVKKQIKDLTEPCAL